MPRFPSKEWAEKFCEELNRSQTYRNAGRGWVWPILFKVKDLPEELKSQFPSGSPGFLLDLNNGECRGVQWFDDASQADAPFILTATFKDWLEIIQGKINPVTAIVRRKLVLEKGSVSTVMRYPVAALEMVKAAQRVGL
jgi:putative sterol carrier protein